MRENSFLCTFFSHHSSRKAAVPGVVLMQQAQFSLVFAQSDCVLRNQVGCATSLQVFRHRIYGALRWPRTGWTWVDLVMIWVNLGKIKNAERFMELCNTCKTFEDDRRRLKTFEYVWKQLEIILRNLKTIKDNWRNLKTNEDNWR